MKILRIPLAIVLVAVGGRVFTANAQTVTTIYSFGGFSTDGQSPIAGLVQGIDSNLYGTTENGGVSGGVSGGDGTVFRISPSGSYTSLYSFAGSPTDGAYSGAGLVQGSDGNFYGTTYGGGTHGDYGTVFRISPSGSYTSLYSFVGSPTDGWWPQAGLVQGSDSNFYGTTQYGGTNGNYGTVFRISPSGDYTSLYSFGMVTNSNGDALDGSSPLAGLVLGNDGNFYGTTLAGGMHSDGTVFRMSPSGVVTTLYSFGMVTNSSGDPLDGAFPQAVLVQGSDSNFYGTTAYGGTYGNYGTVFRISPSGVETALYSFGMVTNSLGDSLDGSSPQAGLVQGSDGNFYGTTYAGGTYLYYGTVFRISPSGVETTLYSFGMVTNSSGDPLDGAYPQAVLVQGSDSNFYGTTGRGGTYGEESGGYGTVFKLAFGSGSGGGGTNCTYSISPTNVVFEAAGGSDSVSVTASNGCDWSATNNDSFITITSGSSGSGDGTVHFSVAANTNSTEQVGTLTIAGLTVTVTEAGVEPCRITLSKTNIVLTAKGGSKNVGVKTKGVDCSWTAVSNNPFITITAGSSGTGSGKVLYSVPGNTNTTPLTGTMTIAGQTVTVNQDAGGCTFKLSPSSGKVEAAGGAGNIKIKPNFSDCEWTVVSGDSFISIRGDTSGVGNGVVEYLVDPNTNSAARAGSITIGGEMFSVTQAGAK